ncbi:chemotaxis protein CheW, partial [Acinetobacter baumannii]
TMAVATPHTRVLVVDVMLADRVLSIGLVADRVYEVAPFNSDQIEQAPDIGVRWNSTDISGVVRRASGFVVLIDLPQLFSD